MSNEWNKVKLIDIIQFNPRESIKKGEIAKKIAMEKLEPFTKKISGYEEVAFTSGTKFRNGDTLLARITPCLENGKTAQVDILDKNEVGFGSTEYIVLREKVGITDNDFIYYLSISPQFRDVAIKAMNGSSGRQRVQKDVLESTEFRLPPLDEQKSIAKILSDLDKKMETNNKINKKLEEMAQAIFKQWFVDFEFPNEDGEPYKSSGGEMVESELGMIPKGWEVTSLNTLMDYQGGSQPPSTQFKEVYSEGYIRLVQIRDYDTKNHITYIPFTNKLKTCNKYDVMLARYGAALGRIMFGLEGAYNVALAKIIPREKKYTEWLRCYLNTDYFYKSLNNKGQRSAQAGFNQSDISSFKVSFPNRNDSLLDSFEKVINNLISMRLALAEECVKLNQFKDVILPKLMSGEIRVPLD